MQAEEEKKRVQADKDTALAKQREAETRPATTAFPAPAAPAGICRNRSPNRNPNRSAT